MTDLKKAIYAGSFDPITVGHLWVIQQICKQNLIDELMICIASNSDKKPFIPVEIRSRLIKEAIKEYHNVSVHIVPPGALLVDFAITNNVSIFIRGLRNIQDFEHEKNMQEINNDLLGNHNFDFSTMYFISPSRFSHISSSLVRELYRLKRLKELEIFVPEVVYSHLEALGAWILENHGK